MKTVIVVWKQHTIISKKIRIAPYLGLGDLVRGLCGMLDVCDKLGYRLHVDMRYHPIGQLFKQQTHGFETLIDSMKDRIYMNEFHTRKMITTELITKLKHSHVWYGAAWCGLYIYEKPISEKSKKFIRELLTPTDDFNVYINTYIPTYEYNILHFRLGDKSIGSSCITISPQILAFLEKEISDTNFILSDSSAFKNKVCELYPEKYKMLDKQICHIGIETDIEKIKATILEFIIASRSKSIHTFSIYHWISGFTNTIHMIYDVPLTNTLLS
jgi:hypothetical protein